MPMRGGQGPLRVQTGGRAARTLSPVDVYRILRTALGASTAVGVVLAAEASVASRRQYLVEADYVVDTTVLPSRRCDDGEPVELRVFGDSTAAGVGSPTVEHCLPVLVARRVADGVGRCVHVIGLGVSGARTDDVRITQLPRLADARVDASLVVIGSNDVTHATPPWLMRKATQELLAETRRRTTAPVILGGIPRFAGLRVLAEPLRSAVDSYARLLRGQQRRAAAALDGITFVDLSALASPRFIGVAESMSPDGFHPGPVGYGFWADALAPAVATALAASWQARFS